MRVKYQLKGNFLFYFILFYFILFYFILFYFILFYFILFYFILFYFILFYFILFYFILFYFILFYFILFYFILFYFILFYFILFYFILEKKKIRKRKTQTVFLTRDFARGFRDFGCFLGIPPEMEKKMTKKVMYGTKRKKLYVKYKCFIFSFSRNLILRKTLTRLNNNNNNNNMLGLRVLAQRCAQMGMASRGFSSVCLGARGLGVRGLGARTQQQSLLGRSVHSLLRREIPLVVVPFQRF